MKIHLMGIGGAGVSALARVLMARGHEVSGCDLKPSDTTAELEDAGVRVELGHDPEHVLFQDLLVYSGAIKSSPELEAARAMGVRVLTRAEMLAATWPLRPTVTRLPERLIEPSTLPSM